MEFVLCCWDVKLSPGVWSMSYTGSVDVYGNVAEADEFNNVCSTNYTLQILDPDD